MNDFHTEFLKLKAKKKLISSQIALLVNASVDTVRLWQQKRSTPSKDRQAEVLRILKDV